MSKDNPRFVVELREYSDSGHDYFTNDYGFETREQAIKFAESYKHQLFDILEYEEGKDYNPKHINL